MVKRNGWMSPVVVRPLRPQQCGCDAVTCGSKRHYQLGVVLY